MTPHSPECIAAKAAFDAWAAKWPRYHQRCYGVGGIGYAGTTSDPPEFDVCSCVDQGRCPRCGSSTVLYRNDDTMHCVLCGWDELAIMDGKSADQHGNPFWAPTWECWCEQEGARYF